MTTGSKEAAPVMPEVRAVRRQARRMAAILRWPLHVILALLFTAWTGLWLAGAYSGKGAGVILIIFGSCLMVMVCFRKPILRAFLGPKTPMILERNASGPLAPGAKSKIGWIAGLVAGGVIGLAWTKLQHIQGGDLVDLVLLSCCLGAGIAATVREWRRTQLWEFILGSVLQVLMWVALLEFFRHEYGMVIFLSLTFAMLYSYLIAISFFLRWRKWVKSLPETVRSEEA